MKNLYYFCIVKLGQAINRLLTSKTNKIMENNKKQEMMLGLKNAVAERDNINVQLCGMYIDLITDILCNNMPNKLFDLEKLQKVFLKILSNACL